MIAACVLVALACAYAACVRRYDARFPARPFPRGAIAWEAAGFATLFFALVVLDGAADASFAAHMAQHVLLLSVAAPALVLGAPVRLLLGVMPVRAARRFARAMRSPVCAALTSPAAAWLYLLAALYGTHFTALYEAALERPWVHVGEHALYLASAALFWSHVFPTAPLPVRLSPPARALYVVIAAPPAAFLGLALVSERAPLYSYYANVANPFGMSPLDDLHAGGAVMWVAGSLFMLLALLAVMARWAHDDHETTVRRERRDDAARASRVARERTDAIEHERFGLAAGATGMPATPATLGEAGVSGAAVRAVPAVPTPDMRSVTQLSLLVAFTGFAALTALLGTPRAAVAAVTVATDVAAGAGEPNGKTTYTVHCSSCHGNDLRGGVNGPSLRGVGAADVDWWVGTGRMPAAVPWVQASRRITPLLSPAEVHAVVAYVTSVAPGGPPIPTVAANGSLQHGRAIFAQNCEHCHGAYAQGNSVGSSYIAPSLDYPTNTQIGEAVRVGVGMMPKFGPRQLSDRDLDDLVTYIDNLRTDRQTPGGLELSSTGPFGEGVVAWLVCGLGITGYAFLIGTRVQRSDERIEPEHVD